MAIFSDSNHYVQNGTRYSDHFSGGKPRPFRQAIQGSFLQLNVRMASYVSRVPRETNLADNPAFFHHMYRSLIHRRNILHRITVHNDKICKLADSDRTDLIVDSH